MNVHLPELHHYQLNDRYTLSAGRVFLTGTQALVRILFDQAARDRVAGINSAGFVSGYRGSPLGSVDLELWRAKRQLTENAIEFLPAVNEDLAATAVLGTQQVETNPKAERDGVFAMWYGKGPGADRAGDALKHGNAYGSSPNGGVLVVAGDDHGCVSSSMPHQTDVAFLTWFMPILAPANVGEYLAFGEYGYALSRFSGMWVGFKAVSETVESAQSVELHPDRKFIQPDFEMPPAGLHYRWPDLPGPQIEERMEAKKQAVFAFAEANPIDRPIYNIRKARYGIVTSGKAHLDTMEALRLLGLDEKACRRLGIDVYKVGMVWPLPRRDALNFVRGKREVLVIEEKRGIIESQLKEYFYDWPGAKPERMVGKNDENLERLLPWTGELSPSLLAPVIAQRLDRLFPEERLKKRAAALNAKVQIPVVEGATRTPYFCSGCPHNISTKVPEGSQALAGIGCHFMANWMDRNTSSLIQMGGEGVNWAASSRFTGNNHVFQNLGEGTWYHSGSMAIRQAIAAGANITYKILYNDAVAMTGGQPVDGPVSVEAIAAICRAEGVERIALVSDDPLKFSRSDFPAGTTIDDRSELDAVQRELRAVKGVSVLIYEQTCATEKRRRRKRGIMEDPRKFAVINDLVCEGCGDCSVESNCLSVEPLETEFGRKRKINLSTCNKDFSCLNGFCPSFVTVEGATRKRKTGAGIHIEELLADIGPPDIADLDDPYDLLVTGVGGTGVVTVGALITMAAHLEGKGSSVLDFTGFAQKFGTVLSFIRLASRPDLINQVRIDTASADAVIGCDAVVTSSPKASSCYHPGTRIVLNLAEMPTGDIVLDRDARLRIGDRQQAIASVVGQGYVFSFNANEAAERLLGDSVYANMMMLGFSWQKGLVPVSFDALMRAIELNGVAIDTNVRAFSLGRIMAANPEALSAKTENRDFGEQQPARIIIARRGDFLTGYQDRAYAERYAQTLNAFAALLPQDHREELLGAAARSLFRLMAYKDEYEVARLHTKMGFDDRLSGMFEPGFNVRYHMAPPALSRATDARGRPRKRQFGAWLRYPLLVLASLKILRGTALDMFGYTAERRMERDLITWFERILSFCGRKFGDHDIATWRAVLESPMDIRGYGPVKEQAAAEVKTRVTGLIGAI